MVAAQRGSRYNELSMADADADRRAHRRFSIQLPVEVRVPAAGQEAAAEHTSTKDISARGLYLSLSRNLRRGDRLECVLTLPPEITQGSSIQVRCLGRVVRVERPGKEGRMGVAATIERYEFLRGNPQ